MGIGDVRNDIPLPKISDQASVSTLPASETTPQASPEVHEANLRQALEVAGQHLQELLGSLKQQVSTGNFVGPASKDVAIDKTKMNLPEAPQMDDSSQMLMMELQKRVSEYSRLTEMISNMMKMLESTSNNVVQNIR